MRKLVRTQPFLISVAACGNKRCLEARRLVRVDSPGLEAKFRFGSKEKEAELLPPFKPEIEKNSIVNPRQDLGCHFSYFSSF